LTEYLRPKGKAPERTRKMQNGMFRNPPTYTALGGFTSERKYNDPSGKRYSIDGMGLERGGPTAKKGQPI
jgi:hypothetical protein